MTGRDLARRGLSGGPSRRGFLKGGALALVGTSVIPSFLMRSVMEAQTTAAASNKKLVVLFQRGAADGLNIVVPYAEKNYYAMRPTIAIQQKDVLDLDGRFGLHPALAAFKPLYDGGHLAIVHAAGSTDTTRSHFDAQDFMESGTPGVKSTQDGWLNRALVNGPAPNGPGGKPSAFRAVALGTQVPRTLQGKLPAIAVNNLADFSVGGKGPQTSSISNAFQAMYDESSDAVLHGTGQETFEAVKMLKAADPAKYQPAAGVTYPNTPYGEQPEADCAVVEGEPWGGGGVLGYRRVGYAPEPGGGDGTAGEPADGVCEWDCGVLEGYGSGRGEHHAGDDVGVRAHGEAEWDGRYGSRACERDVRAGRQGKGRQGVWRVAGARERAAERG